MPSDMRDAPGDSDFFARRTPSTGWGNASTPQCDAVSSPAMDSRDSDALVAHLRPGSHPLLSGRWGGVILLAPGAVIAVIGVAMTISFAHSAATALFGAIIIASGLFAAWSGWGIRRLALARRADPPVAFALDAAGVEVRGKRLGWAEAKFRVDTSVDPPMVICGGGRAAWRADNIDVSIGAIQDAVTRFDQ